MTTALKTFFRDFWTLSGLVITSLVSTILLIINLSGWRGSTELLAKVQDNESTVVLAVQAISQILGLLMALALCEYSRQFLC